MSKFQVELLFVATLAFSILAGIWFPHPVGLAFIANGLICGLTAFFGRTE